MRLITRFPARARAAAGQLAILANVILGCLLAAPGAVLAGETVRIGGTGMALAAMQHLGHQLSAESPDVYVEVLPSLGTSGGVKAVLEGAIDIALATRSATAAERDKGLVDGACMTTALVFASSHASPSNLTRDALPGIFADPMPAWADGSPLKIILRSRTGSELPYVASKIPAMAAAFEAAYRRGGIPVGVTDQENAELAQRTAGSLAIITLLQIRAEKLNLRVARLDGVAPSIATLTDGSYRMPIPVCLLLPSNAGAGARRFIAHLRSPAAHSLLRELGAEPGT